MASPYPTNMVVATVNPAKSANLVIVGVNAEQTVAVPGGTATIHASDAKQLVTAGVVTAPGVVAI